VLYTIFIVFVFSIMQAFLSTFLSVTLALGVAHFFYKFHFFGKRFFISLVLMLCIMPTKLVALCVGLFYGVTGFTGIILAHLMLNIPFALYIINATYEKFDANVIFLAAESGASGWRCYKDIIFPLMRPTVISISLFLFLLHFTSFSIPLILGGSLYHNTPEIMIYNLYNSGNYFYTFGFWLVRLVVILPLLLFHNKYAIQTAKVSSLPSPMPKSRYTLFEHNFLWLMFCGIIAIITLGPLVALLIRACDIKVFNFFVFIVSCVKDSMLGVAVYRVIINSVILAIISGLGSVFVGFLICTVEFKLKSKLGLSIILFISIFAFIISSVGVGIMFAYLSHGKFISSFAIGALCHMILNYAFAYRIIRAQMALYHPDLHKSAQSFGAPFRKVILTVAVPFVFPALLRAFCVSFGLSLTEVGAGSILQGKIGLTIPMAIRMYRQYGNQEAVIGLSLILLFLVIFVTYLLSYRLH